MEALSKHTGQLTPALLGLRQVQSGRKFVLKPFLGDVVPPPLGGTRLHSNQVGRGLRGNSSFGGNTCIVVKSRCRSDYRTTFRRRTALVEKTVNHKELSWRGLPYLNSHEGSCTNLEVQNEPRAHGDSDKSRSPEGTMEGEEETDIKRESHVKEREHATRRQLILASATIAAVPLGGGLLSSAAEPALQTEGNLPVQIMKSLHAVDAKHAKAGELAIRGIAALRDPRINRGLAATVAEREALGLAGLLPAGEATDDVEVRRALWVLTRSERPLQKYQSLVGLQACNENAFYGVVVQDLEQYLPILYTPTVGDACLNFGTLLPSPQGLWVTLDDASPQRMAEVVGNWPDDSCRVAVITDGERILGLGDLGAHGMGIAVGKCHVYVTCGGLRPDQVLPITVDVGTDNSKLREDEFYLGVRRPRLRGLDYENLMDLLVAALQNRYGRNIVVHWEDLGTRNSFKLLERYQPLATTFNDDIQSTAAVTLAGILCALRLTGGTLEKQTFLFFGAGQANIGIADIIVFALGKSGVAPEVARRNVFLFDSQGLIYDGRGAAISPVKRPYAHTLKRTEIPTDPQSLESCIRLLRPTFLIGAASVPGAFTRSVLGAMADINKRPVIFALSNPSSKAECSVQDAFSFTSNTVVFASGSPVPTITRNGRIYRTGFANNAFIFPGITMGTVAAGANAVNDDAFYAAAVALTGIVTAEELEEGSVYPATGRIREAALAVAAAVATCLSANGSTEPGDVAIWRERIAQLMWRPPGTMGTT